MSELSLANLSNDLANVVERTAPSVVQVAGHRRPASGLVFGSGLIVTTTRALGRENGLHVQTTTAAYDAELAGWDPATSLVVLRVAGLDAPAVQPRDTPVRVGELAIAVGRSWSNAVTATAGMVSVIGGPLRTGRGRSIERVIRTSAPMHGGFAGGALVDVTGRLIGLTTAADIRGLGVVIPADITLSTAQSLATHGTMKRGYLGIAGQPVQLTQRMAPDDSRRHGVLVVAVAEGSPAESAGVLIGDVVLTFNGVAIQSPVDLLDALQRDVVGRQATLQALRGGALQELSVTVGEQPLR